MRILALVLVVFAFEVVCKTQLAHEEFKEWMKIHSKNYNVKEIQHRFKVWKQNRDFVNDWNSKVQNASSHEVRLALNHIADLTHEEFRKFYLGLKPHQQQLSRRMEQHASVIQPESDNGDDDMEILETYLKQISPNSDSPTPTTPVKFDWRDVQGALTVPKAQLWCGGCYAFSATAALETCLFMKTGKLVSLSEQNLIDCSWSYGNEGCLGGLMTNAFDYMLKSGGINSEKVYPYLAGEGKCAFKADQIVASVKKYINLKFGDENVLQMAVMQNPVCIGIDADPPSFQFYSSGVYKDAKCSSTELNHGVTLVGYGVTTEGVQYWVVRNRYEKKKFEFFFYKNQKTKN